MVPASQAAGWATTAAAVYGTGEHTEAAGWATTTETTFEPQSQPQSRVPVSRCPTSAAVRGKAEAAGWATAR